VSLVGTSNTESPESLELFFLCGDFAGSFGEDSFGEGDGGTGSGGFEVFRLIAS